MCFFEFFPIFPWLWKKTKKTDEKIEKKTVFFQAFKTLEECHTFHFSSISLFIVLVAFASLKSPFSSTPLSFPPFPCPMSHSFLDNKVLHPVVLQQIYSMFCIESFIPYTLLQTLKCISCLILRLRQIKIMPKLVILPVVLMIWFLYVVGLPSPFV